MFENDTNGRGEWGIKSIWMFAEGTTCTHASKNQGGRYDVGVSKVAGAKKVESH